MLMPFYDSDTKLLFVAGKVRVFVILIWHDE